MNNTKQVDVYRPNTPAYQWVDIAKERLLKEAADVQALAKAYLEMAASKEKR